MGAHKNNVVYNDTSVDKMTTTRHSYPYTVIIKKKEEEEEEERKEGRKKEEKERKKKTNKTPPTPKFSRIADHSLGGNGTRLRQSLINYIPGGGNGNPLQNSCLKNPTDRGA